MTPTGRVLLVRDLDEAVRFYRDVAGVPVRDVAGPAGARTVFLVPPAQPTIPVEAAPLPRPGRVVVVTDDCDATFERLLAAGAEVIQEPLDRPDGARDCAFLDPSGNTLRFTRPASTGTGSTP
jgi:predicted enzyme related to lactoylglutathione lyase